jgi:UDP:flavonoid glycosyltransferase YjiC (YdhE family)
MRVLFTSTPGSGHLGPLFPFAHALRRAGHEVLMAAPVSAQAVVERSGLAYLSFADPLELDLAPYWDAAQNAPDWEAANEIVVGQIFGGVRARAALPGVELAIDAWRPHVLVRETMEFAGAMAAEARELPHVRVGTGLALIEDYARRTAAPELERLREAAGLDPDPEGRRLDEAPYLTLTPPSLEAPGVPVPARTLRYHTPAPRPHSVQDPGEPPLVYLTFGTVAPTMGMFPGLYRAVIHALADLPLRLVVTVGDAADPAELGPLPANVRAERWIPQAEILAEASATIGHGGYGTTLGALLAGVPQVVVPLFADQPYNADRIAAIGAGLRADATDPRTIRAAVERVLADGSYRAAAGASAREAFSLPPIEAAESALRELVATAKERRAA